MVMTAPVHSHACRLLANFSTEKLNGLFTGFLESFRQQHVCHRSYLDKL
jgi:hypothetical protein